MFGYFSDSCIRQFFGILAASCDPLLFVRALATGVPLTHPDAGICTDNIHAQSEALLLRTCESSAPSTWTQGVNVRVYVYDGMCDKFDRCTCNNNFNVNSLSLKSLIMYTPVGYLRNKFKFYLCYTIQHNLRQFMFHILQSSFNMVNCSLE